MISDAYFNRLKNVIRKYFPRDSSKVFIFGSSVDSSRKKFFDIDLGFMGDIDEKKITRFHEELEVVWKTCVNRMPKLKSDIQKLLS